MEKKVEKSSGIEIWRAKTLSEYYELAQAHIEDKRFFSEKTPSPAKICNYAYQALEQAVFLVRQFRLPESELSWIQRNDFDDHERASETKQPCVFAFCYLWGCIAGLSEFDWENGAEYGNWPRRPSVEGFDTFGWSALTVIDKFTFSLAHTIYSSLKSVCGIEDSTVGIETPDLFFFWDFLDHQNVVLEPALDPKALQWLRKAKRDLEKNLPTSRWPDERIEHELRRLRCELNFEENEAWEAANQKANCRKDEPQGDNEQSVVGSNGKLKRKAEYEDVKSFEQLAEAIQEHIESGKPSPDSLDNKYTRKARKHYREIGGKVDYDMTLARLAFARLKREGKRDDLGAEIPTDAIDLLSLCNEAAGKQDTTDADCTKDKDLKENMLSKRERILNIVKDIRGFKFCGPSDDPDEQTSVCVGYHYLLTQLKRMATQFLPESIGKSLNRIEVEMNNVISVYEARAEVYALLSDIERIIQDADESVFDPIVLNTKPYGDEIISGQKELLKMTSNDHYTEQEHRDFLRKIANEVYELLRDPTNMARFRSQVNLFCEKNEAYQVEVQQLREASKADSKLQAALNRLEKKKWGKLWNEMTEDERAVIHPDEYYEGPPEGYKEFVHHGDFWGPPTKTVNLLFYLSTPIDREYLDYEKQWDTWRLEALKSSNDEKIISCYALLTAIHDQEIPEKPIYINKVYNGSWHLRDEWIQKLSFNCRNNRYPSEQDPEEVEGEKDMQAWIARAFDDVKADLAGIEKATVEHEVEPVKEAANLKMETVVDAKEDPVLQDLAKQLFNLDKVIVDLKNYKGCDPEHYVYDLNQTLEKILNVKKLATTLFNQLKLPRLRDLAILLVKLHRDVQYIHDGLDSYNSPCYVTIHGGEELNAKIAKEADAECDDILSNKVPELIEKYHIAVEEFAATFDVDSVIQVQGQAETDEKKMAGIEILQEQFKAAANKYPGLEHTLEDRLTEDCAPVVSSFAAQRRMKKLMQRWNNKEKGVKYSPWLVLNLHMMSASGVRKHVLRPKNEKGYPKDHYLHRSPHQQWDAEAAVDLLMLRAEEAGKLLIDLPELKGLWVTDPAEYWLLALHRVFPGLKLKTAPTEDELDRADGDYHSCLHPQKGDEYFEVLDDVFAKSALLCGKLFEIVKGLPKDLPREPKADCAKNEEQKTEQDVIPSGNLQDDNIFKKTSDYWTVRYQGVNVDPLKDLIGMSYIAKLLAIPPGEKIAAIKLVRSVKGLTGEIPRTSVQQNEIGESDEESDSYLTKVNCISPENANKLMDDDYLKECLKEKRRLNDDLERAKKNRDIAEEDRKQAEINQLEIILSSATYDGKARQFRNESEKAKGSIKKNVRRANINIKKQSEALFLHIENTIRIGYCCSYNPDRKMNWQL